MQWQVNDGAGNLVGQWTGWLRDIRQRDLQTGFGPRYPAGVGRYLTVGQ